jgi:hypothetical protein
MKCVCLVCESEAKDVRWLCSDDDNKDDRDNTFNPKRGQIGKRGVKMANF